MAAMKRRLTTPATFATLARQNARNGEAVFRLADGAAGTATETTRTVPYVFSTGAVARDGHTINQAGWQLDDFKKCPSFLWAHSYDEPPIGQVVEIYVAGGELRGVVQYADAATYPFADTIFRLVQGKFIRAVSVSWDPIEWKWSTDRNRPQGIDFQKQTLLEVSQAPVPVDPACLSTARSQGINTAPLATWAERALDMHKPLPFSRAELTAVYRNARAPARAPTRIAECIRTDTRAGRAALWRELAYEGAALGCELPVKAWPPQTRREREMILKGHKLRMADMVRAGTFWADGKP